ncbi:MAG TPA: DUF2089 family protein, partial [Candidatus Binatus sp.]|nr:DUF2089 family protein [Candidatus Binatus sp.]
RELGISYPTVRSRVEALVRALGFGPRADSDEAAEDAAAASAAASASATSTADAAAARQGILERLARRELSAEDAAVAIRNLGRTDR